MSSLQNLLLLHRGLFYERPIIWHPFSHKPEISSAKMIDIKNSRHSAKVRLSLGHYS